VSSIALTRSSDLVVTLEFVSYGFGSFAFVTRETLARIDSAPSVSPLNSRRSAARKRPVSSESLTGSRSPCQPSHAMELSKLG
jgi:hypothetical protein